MFHIVTTCTSYIRFANLKMSVKLICKPEFFSRRLNFQLGLHVTVEPGTTYFLCNDLTDIPALVSSQGPLGLTALSDEGKVQILVCNDTKSATLTDNQPIKVTLDSATCVPGKSSLVPDTPKCTPLAYNQITCMPGNVDCEEMLKRTTSCTVTSSSGESVNIKEENTAQPPEQTAQAPVLKVPGHNPFAILSGRSTMSKCVTSLLASTAPHDDTAMFGVKAPGSSVPAPSNSGNIASFPGQELRHELKKTILNRRKNQGMTVIDLMKEEDVRQLELRNITLTHEDKVKSSKRRACNNRAARKCRKKRKVQEDSVFQEVKRLREHKTNLNEMISTLEQKQSILRQLCLAGSGSDDATTKEMLQNILNTEVVIPEFPRISPWTNDGDFSNSGIISSSECNSDDTRTDFELDNTQGQFGIDSSQDTNDSRVDQYTEMTGEEINSDFGDVKWKNNAIKCEVRKFKEISNKCEDDKLNSDYDSDVELIGLEKPLVIDVN